MMSALETFMAYAKDFEETYEDDNWARLEKYFAGDVVYRVQSTIMPCELKGTQAIFAGMQKSLNGFDRRFASRSIQVHDDMQVTATRVELGWTVTYTLEGQPNLDLVGRSCVTVEGGLITELQDSYSAADEAVVASWATKTGISFDASYI